MAYALVSAGTVATATGTVAPAFGQATTAGNMLIAWVAQANDNINGPTVSDPRWTQIVEANQATTGPTITIWALTNCLENETAPTFTETAVALFATLAEFSGATTGEKYTVISNVVDHHASGSGSTSPQSASTLPTKDPTDLVVTVGAWKLTTSATCTTADTYANGAVPTLNLNNDATATTFHYRFAYGITTGNASNTSVSESCTSSSSISGGAVGIAALFPRQAFAQGDEIRGDQFSLQVADRFSLVRSAFYMRKWGAQAISRSRACRSVMW